MIRLRHLHLLHLESSYFILLAFDLLHVLMVLLLHFSIPLEAFQMHTFLLLEGFHSVIFGFLESHEVYHIFAQLADLQLKFTDLALVDIRHYLGLI